MKVAAAAVAVAVAVVVAAWLVRDPPTPPSKRAASLPIVQGAPVAQTPATPPQVATSAPPSPPSWLAQHASMRGAQLDGHWGRLDAQGQLVPEPALRRRFDHLLTLQGEARIEQMQAFVTGDVHAQHGPAQAQQVLALWSRYLELLRYRFATPVAVSDRQSWLAALAERQPVRQRILGLGWAEAFYADEERALREAAAASAPAAAALVSPAGLDPSTLDAAARERLAAEKATWADWESRLALAMQEWQRLTRAPELSDLQRHDAFERWLTAHFSASEARRVRLLVTSSTQAGR